MTKEALVGFRNKLVHAAYAGALKPAFFRFDPEKVHDRMTAVGERLGRHGLGRVAARAAFGFSDPRLAIDVLGIRFPNPVGLGAGFDKDAVLTDILPSVGFGFVEVGSITGKPCRGNPKPRLWRIPDSKGLVVYYGLKNEGAEAIGSRLEAAIARRAERGLPAFDIPVGTSVAMTNCAENLDTKSAIDDYAAAFRRFASIGDYFTVNVSCPNAEGGQPFMAPHKLDYLFDILDEIETAKPIFVKLSPDMSFDAVDEMLDVLRRHRVHGIVCTNLTKKRDNPKIAESDRKRLPPVGGISGKPVQDLSDALVSHVYRRENLPLVRRGEAPRFALVGLGGVFTAEDAYRKIRSGASLVQLVTGMIFEGPQAASEINRGLIELLERDGFKSVSEAVAADVR